MADDLWNTLSNFVNKTCFDRDVSHGHGHMELVAKNSLEIYHQTYGSEKQKQNSTTRDLICVVAWCHDVNDSKYATDNNKLALDNFLHLLYNSCPQFRTLYDGEEDKFVADINTTINYISYSKEVKLFGHLKPARWHELLPENLVVVRNIVSDADKIESLGITGFTRCFEYSRHKNPELADCKHYQHVVDHYNDKLCHLYDHYIVTEAGKRLALPHHLILKQEVAKLIVNS
jgi:hypothetical protein